MTREELQACVKGLGWGLVERKKWNKQYMYAIKRRQGKLIEKYLFPSLQVANKHQLDIWDKLLEA